MPVPASLRRGAALSPGRRFRDERLPLGMSRAVSLETPRTVLRADPELRLPSVRCNSRQMPRASLEWSQLLHGAPIANLNDFLGAVKIHESNRAQRRLDDDIRPVLSEAVLSDAGLHDVD
jgi:hypothetical protein